MDYFKSNALKWINESYLNEMSAVNRRLKIFVSIVNKLKPESILDVGCGDGRFLNSLSNIPIRYGIDSSDEMLTLAQKSSQELKLINADLNSPNFTVDFKTSIKFQIITMLGVIHYLKSPIKTLNNLKLLSAEKSYLVLNFRNKLFNLNPESKYINSPLTRENKQNLTDELCFWNDFYEKKDGGLDNNFKAALFDDFFWEEQNLLDLLKRDWNLEGETDNFWNPENLEIWRQFTPLEMIFLLRECGYQVLNLRKLEDAKGLPIFNRDDFREESTLIIVAISTK